MKEVVAEAKKEIFEGKSVTVKNKIEALMGSVDGVKARKAIMLKKVDKELEDAEAELERFTSMTVEDAFNEITAPAGYTGVVGSCTIGGNSGPWQISGSMDGYPMVFRN